MSTSKNRFTVIEIHKVPPHSSIKQFTAKLEALADARLARPTAQKNLLKYDIMVPNDRLDLELNARGFQESQPIILVQKEFETIDDCRELLRDEAIAKSVSTAHEFIGASSPVAISAADVVIRIDDSTKAQSNADMCMHVIVFEAAANESGQQLYERIKTDADRIVQLPIMQKHVAMHNMVVDPKRGTVERAIGAGGPSSAAYILVVKLQATLDHLKKIFADSGFKQFHADREKPARDAELTHRFSMDVINKLDRA